MIATIPALVKAVGIWILVYLCLAHCFVVWKLQTPGIMTTSSSSSSSSIPPDDHHLTVNVVPQPKPMSPVEEERYHQLQHMVQQLQAAIQQSTIRNEQLQQQLQQQQQQQHVFHQIRQHLTTESVAMDDDDDDNDLPSQPPQHSGLQLVSSLVQSSHHPHSSSPTEWKRTIRTLLPPLRQELQQWTMQQEWNRIQSILNVVPENKPPTNRVATDDDDDDDAITSTTVFGECGTTTTTTATTATTTTSRWATPEQLQSLRQHLHENVFLSQSALPLSLPTSIQSVQQFLHRTVQDTIHERRNGTAMRTDDETDTTVMHNREEDASSTHPFHNCVPSLDGIPEWINVGFDTIYRHSGSATTVDVRRDFLQALYQHHRRHSSKIDMTNVMLEIPSFVTTYQTQQQQQMSSATTLRYDNLRRYLDRPSVYEVSIYIDTALDAISGRYNVWDDMMDRYLYNNPHLVPSESSSLTLRPYPSRQTSFVIGPSIVAHIMNALGHIPIPTTAWTKQFLFVWYGRV